MADDEVRASSDAPAPVAADPAPDAADAAPDASDAAPASADVEPVVAGAGDEPVDLAADGPAPSDTASDAVAQPSNNARLGSRAPEALQVGTTAVFDVAHSKLLPGWSQILDTASGRNYYVNTATGETTWSRSVATGAEVATPRSSTLMRTVPPKDGSVSKVAREKGIGDPVVNKEAALMMSQTNPANYDPPSPPSGERKRLPVDLKNDIEAFGMEGFARKHFTKHKRGIFRRKVPLASMLTWTKDAIPQPLLEIVNKNAQKDAVSAWKILQRAMGDRTGTSKYKSVAAAYQPLVEMGINQGQIRDELYVQLCKQLTSNPAPESAHIGWDIMAVYSACFPPSKNFETYLATFVQSAIDETKDPRIKTYAEAVKKRLKRIARTGPKGKLPTLAEIERAAESPMSPSLFGELLEDIMAIQNRDFPGALPVPRIMPFLTEAVLKLNGQRSEGIFRVPGDAEMVTELRLRVEKHKYDMEGITDPGVPASLFKLWLRELADPVVTADLYDEAVKHAEDADKCIELLTRLPEINRNVILFTIRFLQKIADPANVPHTKMSINNLAMVFAPNFLRCPSDNPQVIFENTKHEQAFVRNLIMHLDTSAESGSSCTKRATPLEA